MGSYLNPTSARFEKLKQTKVFVDKTGIFEILILKTVFFV